MPDSKRVLMVCPPWQSPVLPSLAIATLRPILDAAGIACDELHSSTLYPITPSISHRTFLARVSGFLFGSLLVDSGFDRDRLIARVTGVCRRDQDLGGMLDLDPEHESSFGPVVAFDLARGFKAAQDCIDRCMERILAHDYDVIGMSVTFEVQIPAALVMAKKIKALRPEVKVIMGGAACAGEQGDGILTSFDVLDAVCRSEGEAVIVPLIRAMRGELPLDSVPGIAYRRPDGTVARTASPPLLMDLDELPMPAFADFFEQYGRSAWAEHAAPHLTFETSRGCWYGEKQLCSFCGLNGEGLAYRRKSPERAFREIRSLYQDYPGSGYLEATDNILDMGYIKELMPRLAQLPQDPKRPLELFFEIKSNLRRDQVHALVLGHVVAVQPGIESFSDGVLDLMNKGCTGAGQVQFLKWIDEAGIKPTYNILLRNPGEKAEWYREMEELVPYLEHLAPPTGMSPMNLERFSPYHTNQDLYGIKNVRPRPYYADLYPHCQIDERVAYTFDFDHEMLHDAELLAAHRSFTKRVVAWQENWKPGTLLYIDKGETVELHDRRHGKKRMYELRGVAADVFRYLNSARKPASLKQQFADVDPALIDCLVDVWRRRRWVCFVSGRLLAVVPEFFPDGLAKAQPPKPRPVARPAARPREQPGISAEMR